MNSLLEQQKSRCPHCLGSGKNKFYLDDRLRPLDVPHIVKCELCNGTGFILEPISKTLERVQKIALKLAEYVSFRICKSIENCAGCMEEDNEECIEARINFAFKNIE